jgi:cytochrome c-type biogenesis protein CcmH
MTLISHRLRIVLSLLGASAVVSGSAVPAIAAAGCPRTTELAMESKVMCQVCGVPLALANSLEADRERAFITNLVNRCESSSQIEAAMVAQYGPGILASPGSHGFATAAWLVPVMGVLGAALAIAAVVVFGRRRRMADEAAITSRPVTASEDARLDAALTAFNEPLTLSTVPLPASARDLTTQLMLESIADPIRLRWRAIPRRARPGIVVRAGRRGGSARQHDAPARAGARGRRDLV